MNCCEKCFVDKEIKSIIKGQRTAGNCDFCGSEAVHIYDTNDSEKLLSDLLYGLLCIYTTSKGLPDGFPDERRDLLKNILHNDWYIFSLNPEKIYKLLRAVCSDKYNDDPELFDSTVGLPNLCDDLYLNKNSLLKSFEWESFVKSIKNDNRFHSNHINTDILGLFVEYAKISHKAGSVFYRARICTDPNGFLPNEMGAPPSKVAKAGRVNAEGISVLYLGDSIETVVYEVRAGRYDYISIGKFELLEDIEIVSLDSLKNISPFIRGGDIAKHEDMVQHAVNLPHLARLSHEVARPLRRSDSALDYLPTQYISDFIKNQPGISGISYKSTMAESGTNLAAFKPSCFRCIDIEVLEITGIQYQWNKVATS